MCLIYPHGNNYPEALECMELGREVWVGFMNVGVLDKDTIFLSPLSRGSCLRKVGRE